MTGNSGGFPAWFIGVAVGLGLALRLVFSLGYWTGQPMTRDEREYFSLARSLAAGRGFTYDAAQLGSDRDPFGRAPGYPVFLALAGGGRDVVSSIPAGVKIAQAIVGAAGIVLIAIVAHRLAGPAAARAAALTAACYPPLVWIGAYGYSEAIVWPLGVGLVWLFDRAVEPRQSGKAAGVFLSGVLSGLLILTRPATVLFLLMAAVWLLARKGLPLALAFSLGGLVVMAPWTIRNYGHYGRIVLVATEGGVTFWTGNHPLAIGEGDLAANPALKRESLALRLRHPALSEEEMEPVYYREAFSWMREHPWRWLSLEARKAFYLVVPVGPSYLLHSTRYYMASLVSYVLLLPAALVGCARLGRRRRSVPGLWLLGGSAVTACVLFFPQERFRIPVIDPVLIICASAIFLNGDETRARTRPDSGAEAPAI